MIEIIRSLGWIAISISTFAFADQTSGTAVSDIPPYKTTEGLGLSMENGWYIHDGNVIWGYAQHNAWWRPGQRPNIARNAPGQVKPNRTEDLDKLTDAMVRYAYPGFEHNFGLWYDRRRDAHDTDRRNDDEVVPPFLEQPWARSGSGTAWDGLSKYDLTKYNDWYFSRLREFASLCDQKGTILFHNNYMQHVLLETNAHYVDFPWRPINCIQDTGMPDCNPTANVFYDISHSVRRNLHRDYIRKCLDELSSYCNVVFLCSIEYTGPLSFMEFWLDTVFEWEQQTGKDIHVAVGVCKDVLDAILSDPIRGPKVSTVDLRYWWYRPDGTLFAPGGGKEIPGRYIGAFGSNPPGNLRRMMEAYTDRGMGFLDGRTAQQIYRQVREYRQKYPDKGIIHRIPSTRQETWAFLMAGGSMLIDQLPYPNLEDPDEYISPEKCEIIQPTYDFIRRYLASSLPKTKPHDLVLDHPERNWCLAEAGHTYLVYVMEGGQLKLDLSDTSGILQAKWFDPRTGNLTDCGQIRGGEIVTFTAPGKEDWLLWLTD